jgi:hypothetical protein
MENKNGMRYIVACSFLLGVLMVMAAIARKGWLYGLLALIVSAWLNLGPIAYIKNWSIPLLGPFAYENGQRQIARLVAVCVMTGILFLLTINEVLQLSIV